MSLVENPKDKFNVVFSTKGDTYNYAIIKTLSCNLYSPFSQWDYTISKTLEPHSKFNIDENDPCPCNSGKTYKKCCLKRKGVLKDEIKVTYHTPPLDNRIKRYTKYYIHA